MQKSKLLCSVAVLLCSATLFTGCDGVFETSSSGTGGLVKGDVEDGIYILTADDEKYAPNTDHQNFKDNTTVTSADNSRIVYSVNGDNEIPTLYADDKLVMYSSGAIPDSLNIEKFTPTGWTFGIYGLTESTNGGYKITSDNLVEGSNASAQLSSALTNSDSVSIYSIDKTDLDEKYEFSKADSFKGMEKGEKHTLGVYAGSYYADIDILADTKMWSSQVTSTTAGYKRTKDGYVEILTGNLENGYYSFEGSGLIKVVTDEKRPEQ